MKGSLIRRVSLGEFFFFVAINLVSGKDHECPILYDLVEQFLQVVGSGVMKWLIVDRGFLDCERTGYLKRQWSVDTLSWLRIDMNVLEDARGLLRLEPVEWQDYYPPEPPPSPVTVARPESIKRREMTRQRTLKAKGRWPKPPPPEKVVALGTLNSCPVPLTVVLTQRHDDKPPWGLVTTAHTKDAPFVRGRYSLREAIEERHRQTKLFWDLTGFHSPNFNLVTN